MFPTFQQYVPQNLRSRFSFYTTDADGVWNKVLPDAAGAVRTSGNIALVPLSQSFPDTVNPTYSVFDEFNYYAAIYGGRNLPLFIEVAGFAYGLHPYLGDAAVSLMVACDTAFPLPEIAELWAGYGPERSEYVDFNRACIRALYGEDLGAGYYSALRATLGHRRDFHDLMYDAACHLAERAGYQIIPDAFGGVEPYLFRTSGIEPSVPLEWDHTAGTVTPEKAAPALAKARAVVDAVKG